MATLSVSVDEDMKEKISHLEEINWSAVARKAFEQKLMEVTILKDIASRSKLTEKDAQELSRKINENMAKKFRSR